MRVDHSVVSLSCGAQVLGVTRAAYRKVGGQDMKVLEELGPVVATAPPPTTDAN